MNVILKKDIKGTGKAGDVVKVSDGYARNMLIPKGYAIEATPSNVTTLERQKANELEKKKQEKKEAEELAEKLKAIKVTIKTKAGEGGRVFGSITSKDITDELNKQHSIVIDKKKVQLDGAIKNTGEIDVDIKLYQGVTAKLKLEIIAE